jgi:glycosyltransferase involved in cell wall biosynthesis
MQKILYVITKSNWGGAQRYVFDLATNLPKAEFEVAVAAGGQGALKEKLHASGVRVIDIAALQRDVSLMADLKSFFELYRLFKKERPDVVHLNSSKAGGVGALAARAAGVPNIIFTIHGLPYDEPRNILWRLAAYLGTWATILFSTNVITVSADNHRRVPRSVLIYNGIAPLSLGTGETIRNAFPAGAKITGTIGELNKNKNQIVLVEQARNNPDMYVAIVGEGELRGFLEQKIKEYKLQDRVKLFGFIPASEALRGFDVFALPSLKEGLPYVLLEARQAGLPIEANRVGGIPEILDAKDMSEFSLDRMVQKTIELYRADS